MSPGAVCGIILHPAGHTLSPVIHAAAYRVLALDASFRVFDVPAAELANAISRLRASGLTQLCVSLPHKRTALRLADRASDDARAIGAANTLTLRAGELFEAVRGRLVVIAYEHGEISDPRPAIVQRLCAIREKRS